MDRGLISFTRDGRMYFRQRMLYPWPVYVLAAAINLVLQFAWAAHVVPGLHQLQASYLVLLVEVVEVCRRAMRNMVHIEWEILVQQDRLTLANRSKDDSHDLL